MEFPFTIKISRSSISPKFSGRVEYMKLSKTAKYVSMVKQAENRPNKAKLHGNFATDLQFASNGVHEDLLFHLAMTPQCNCRRFARKLSISWRRFQVQWNQSGNSQTSAILSWTSIL
mmetsp:Transcript_5583/g.11569  ORF Transcript_5583/g.11569 Transcript_5583/m.11569 type:complete len:117 (+) Transcript_5583:580-930(+)